MRVRHGVGVYHFTELATWRLADEVRREVIAYTDTPACKNDRRFCNDARAAAESAPSNTAEGFSRFRPAEFLTFLRYARASLSETQDHLISAARRRYIDEPTFGRLWLLSRRAIKANEGLQRYLAGCIASGFNPNFWPDARPGTSESGSESPDKPQEDDEP